VRITALDFVGRASTGELQSGRKLSTALRGVRGPPAVGRVGAQMVCMEALGPWLLQAS